MNCRGSEYDRTNRLLRRTVVNRFFADSRAHFSVKAVLISFLRCFLPAVFACLAAMALSSFLPLGRYFAVSPLSSGSFPEKIRAVIRFEYSTATTLVLLGIAVPTSFFDSVSTVLCSLRGLSFGVTVSLLSQDAIGGLSERFPVILWLYFVSTVFLCFFAAVSRQYSRALSSLSADRDKHGFCRLLFEYAFLFLVFSGFLFAIGLMEVFYF